MNDDATRDTPVRQPDDTAPREGSGAGGADPAAGAALDTDALREGIVTALKTVYDPEIPVNIYELGLVYEVNVSGDGAVHVKMTLTSPACPVAGSLPGEVERTVLSVDGVSSANVELVWDPPWDREMMSEAAKLQLGFF